MKYFGTDGIRQKADGFTTNFLASIVKGIIDYKGSNIKVLIGGDTRESTERILADLAASLETFGIEYGNVGVLATPAINYCFSKMGFDIAIDVTASHNPYVDNGIKIFEIGENGSQKLCEKGCEFVEKAIEEGQTFDLTVPSTIKDLHNEAIEIYKEHLKSYIGDVDLSSLHIGLDCANGATSTLNKTVFEEYGANVELISGDSSYGQKINSGCGSTHLENLIELVKTKNLDFGIAFDGDGDRVLMIDQNGETVDGDQIIAIVANSLGLKSVAVTVMANQGILNWAKEQNIALEITAVGDSNVAAAMREKNIAIGGEQSGHIILPGEATGDGMLTALLVCKIAVSAQKNLAELSSIITKFPQVILALDATPEQKKRLESPEAKVLLSEYEEKLQSTSGRLLVRPSGTENLIRITMWGEDENEITMLANELKTKLGEIL